jgi:hypothetical protein
MSTNNIVLVLYDYSQPDWKDISQRLIEFTQYNLHGSNLPVVITTDIDQTLKELCNTYDWAIVIAAGTKICNIDIFQQTVEHCVKEKSPLAAHLLLRNNYVHFHPQFFCLDLAVFKGFDDSLLTDPNCNTLVSVPIEWSKDFVHDNYTPWWVGPKSNNHSARFIVKGLNLVRTGPVEFGQRFIAYLTNNGYRAVNIPQRVRSNKIYCYAEDSYHELRAFMSDPEYVSSQIYGVGKFIENVRPRSQLGNFYPINSEQVQAIDKKKYRTIDSIKIFAGVCGGLKPAIIVTQPEFDPDCRVILFDISEIAIEWQKYLRQHWNGDFDNFEKIYTDFFNHQPKSNACIIPGRDLDLQIDWMLNDQCTREEFKKKWAHWLTLQIDYVHCDLLQTDAQLELLQRINQIGGTSYIWTSNLFRMEWQFFFYGKQWTVETRQSWLDLARQHKTARIILENEELFYVY